MKEQLLLRAINSITEKMTIPMQPKKMACSGLLNFIDNAAAIPMDNAFIPKKRLNVNAEKP